MPTLKFYIKPKNRLDQAVAYALRCVEEGAPAHAENVSLDSQLATKSFIATQQLHEFKGSQQYVSIIQSFSPEESKKLGQKGVNSSGVELTEKYFKGHQFIVGTHNDKNHLHNHIVINKVNSDTGRVVKNKNHLYPLRDLNDAIARERGLNVIKKDHGKKYDKEAYNLEQKRIKYDSYPYIRDLKQKANVALSFSTDFNEYAGILQQFDIGVRVEKENISYFYPTRKRPVRGKYLGEQYERKELIKSFALNEQKFISDPKSRGLLTGKIDSLRNEKGGSKRDSSDILLQSRMAVSSRQEKNQNFTSDARRNSRTMYPSESELRNISFPLNELRKAQAENIPNYCKRNNINLKSNKDGVRTIKGRDYVHVYDDHWINTKNKTKGGLVELVAIHQNTSFIGAVSTINSNPNLLILESRIGKQSLTYRSFHIPKNIQLNAAKTKASLLNLFNSKGWSRNKAERLLEKNQVQADKKGNILIFGEEDNQGALEFNKDQDGKWTQSKKGVFQYPLFSKHRNSQHALIISKPSDYFKDQKQLSNLIDEGKSSILVMMDKNHETVENFLATNKHIKSISFFSSNSKSITKGLNLFIEETKKRLEPFDIKIEQKDPNELQKNKARFDMDFH